MRFYQIEEHICYLGSVLAIVETSHTSEEVKAVYRKTTENLVQRLIEQKKEAYFNSKAFQCYFNDDCDIISHEIISDFMSVTGCSLSEARQYLQNKKKVNVRLTPG